MSDEPQTAQAKRERILAVSRTVHAVPVEEGGMLRPPRPPAAPPPPPRGWRVMTLGLGGIAAVAAGLWFGRRR